MDLSKILAELHRRIDYVDAAIAAFERIDAFERTDFPQRSSHKFIRGITKQRLHEGISIDDLSALRIEHQDAVGRGFKKPPVARLRNPERFFNGERWRGDGHALGAFSVPDRYWDKTVSHMR